MTKARKIAVEIVKETKKAKLVKDAEGREAWVQNRSYKDGLVNEAVFEKGVQFLADRDEAYAAHKEYNEALHTVFVAWENEKTIGVDFMVESTIASSLYHEKRVRAFFPKNMCVFEDGRWQVKGWLLEAKKDEALAKLDKRFAYGFLDEFE